jgi:hypothetical protein
VRDETARVAPLVVRVGSKCQAFCKNCRYNAASSVPRLDQEVHHASQERTPRIRLLSRSVANVEKVFRRKLKSNAGIASWAAERNSWRN